MAYNPTPIVMDPWSSPKTIESYDLITDLDDAVNDIIQDDSLALVPFFNAQMAKLPGYLVSELQAIEAEVEQYTGLSKAYAVHPENDLIPGTSDYSSLHWAKKAEADADRSIVESGENNNGSYIKFSDGTLYQYGRIRIAQSPNQETVGHYPIEFPHQLETLTTTLDVPHSLASSGVYTMNSGGSNLSFYVFAMKDGQPLYSAAEVYYCMWAAIGRWK